MCHFGLVDMGGGGVDVFTSLHIFVLNMCKIHRHLHLCCSFTYLEAC